MLSLADWLEAFYRPDPLDLIRLCAALEEGPAPSIAVVPLGPPGTPWRARLDAALERQAYRRFHVVERDEAAEGPVLLLREGALPRPYALYLLARLWRDEPGWEALYADEVLLGADGAPAELMAKCAWSPELCLARDDVSAFLALGRGWRGRAEPPLPDLLVRELFERGPAGVRHLPIPLSDREPGLAPLDLAPAAAAWCAGQGLRVEGEGPESRRVLPAARPGRVSVIVATHEQPLLLRRCLAALEATAGGPGLELLLIDHDNRSEAARSVIEAAAGRPGTRVLPRSGVFNYAAFMNEAARAATGDVLLFLNDDTEALAPGWLEEMAAHAVRPGIGAVGAKLLYPDRTVQHGGVVLLGAAGAAHLGTGLGADDPGPGGRLRHLGGISAVTGAAMAVERRRFEAAGGFDDRYFAVNYNDVDLCLKLGQAGLRTLVAPRAVLVHHESATRRRDSRDGRMLEGGRELHALISRWDLAGRPDPFYNPNLDGRDRTGALAVPPRQALPWRTRDLDLAALAERARATGRRRGRGQADFDLALAAYRMGRLEEAAAAVRRAVDASRPGDRDFGAMLNLAGMVAERRDRMDEAEAFLRRAVAAEPGRVEFRHNLGNFLARRRRVEEAAACWSQVLADNPHFLESRISLAVALLALGRPAEALAQAVRGLEAEPAHAKLLPAAARAARQAGNPALALAFLEGLRASPGRPPDLDREIAAAEAEAAKDPRPAPAAALPEPRPGGIVLLAAVGGDAEPDALADALAGAARDGAAVVAVAGAETPEPVLARLRAALAGTPALLLEGIPSADRAALLNVALAAAEGGHVAAVDDPARLDRRTLRLLACGAAAPDAPDVVAAVPLPRALAGAVTPAPGHAGLEWLAGGPAVLAVRTDLAARLGGVSAGCGGQELYELGLRALAAAPGPAVLAGMGTPGDAAAAPVPAPVLARRRDAFLRRYAARDGGAAVGGAGTLLSVPPAPATVSIIPVGPVGPAWADAAADALWPRDPRSPLEVVDPSSDRVVAYQGDAVRIAGAGPGAGTGADGLAGLVGQCGGDVLVFADPCVVLDDAEALLDLAAQALRDGVAAASPGLLAPDGSVASLGCRADPAALLRRNGHGAATGDLGWLGPGGPPFPVDWPDPACVAIARGLAVKLLAEVGAAPCDRAGLLALLLAARRAGTVLAVPSVWLTLREPAPAGLLAGIGRARLAGLAMPLARAFLQADGAPPLTAVEGDLPMAGAAALVEAAGAPDQAALLRRSLARLSSRLGEVLARDGAALPPAPARPPDGDAAALPAFVLPAEVDLSIVIPVHNQVAFTRACLRSLAALAGEARFEVILVDDASTDATAELAAVPGLRYLRLRANRGFIGACNAGAALAAGRYLLFLNNDTEVRPGALAALLATARDVPDAGIVGAKLVYPDGRLQEAGGILWRDGSGWNVGRGGTPDAPAFDHRREVDYCSGAAILVPAALFRDLGGFDPHFAPAYGEDSDLALKVQDRGLRVIYQPLAEVVHHEGASCGTDTAAGVKAHQPVNQRRLAARWAERLSRHPALNAGLARAMDRRSLGRFLVIDACTPTPDQDAGSVTALETMRILQTLGYAVSFVPDNLLAAGRYTDDLRRIGIECWHRPHAGSVRQLLEARGRQFDGVLVFRHQVLARHLNDIRQLAPHAPVLFQVSDLHHLRQEREAALSGDADARAAAAAVREAELALVAAADHTIVHSEAERRLLARAVPGAPVSLFGWVVDPPADVPGFAARRDIVFLGGYRHPPNVDAAVSFCAEVMPLLRLAGAGIRLHLVGSNAPAAVRALAADDVVVAGHVADLDAYLQGRRVMVAPLRYGAGIKGKVLAGMANGLPVVLSPIAAEGMPVEDGRDVRVAATAEETAAAILELHADGERWNALSEAGRRLVRERFSRAAATAQLGAVLDAAGLPPFRGRCPVCGAGTRFAAPPGAALPHGLACGRCGATGHDRAVARVLLDMLGGGQGLDGLAVPGRAFLDAGAPPALRRALAAGRWCGAGAAADADIVLWDGEGPAGDLVRRLRPGGVAVASPASGDVAGIVAALAAAGLTARVYRGVDRESGLADVPVVIARQP